jgi:hypothetical protein
MPKAAPPPVVANPLAREQLERAAAAAGLTVQQLADLVFESGVVPPKAADGVVQRYTLEDLGTRLWGTMQGVPRSDRAAWFAALVPVQKTSMIVVLRDHGFRTETIARDLGISTEDVLRTWNAYAGQLGAQVVGIRLDTIAGQLQLASEHAQQLAIANGDAGTYWKIEKEKIELLQGLGIVDKAIQKVEHTHKIDDQQKAEIEELFKLRQKQQKARIQVEAAAQIEGKGDDLPAEVADADYDGDDDE